MSDIRKKAIVLIEAQVLGIDGDKITLNIPGNEFGGRHVRLPIDKIKRVVNRPFVAGDPVRWYPKAEAPRYHTGNFVGMLRDSQVVICRGKHDGALFEVELDTLQHEGLKP